VAWSIADKSVLITGANSGIGKATAKELARRGADVMITARDDSKGRAAAEEIRNATGAEVSVGSLDLSQLDSVRAFASDYLGTHDQLDVLINNAGVMAGGRRETPDGLEWTLAVNHLGPFLLTYLLSDLLVSSAPARVITVSSEAHQREKGGLDFDDLEMRNGYSPSRAYAASKLANVLFTVELDRRLDGSGVTAKALHPGVVATSFGKDPESPKWMGLLMVGLKPFLRKPEQGARTSVFLATADDTALDAGLYWSDEAPIDPIPAALDTQAAARLWSESEHLVGLKV
jgi:NAD(P)-dependent dehydrogenase (short-subunit alcohol dehydrogenase family)